MARRLRRRASFLAPDDSGNLVPTLPDGFATFILSATIGSLAVELVYLILAVAAFGLVRQAGNKWWQYAIVAIAVLTPVLGYLGALKPDPHDRSNVNWEALYWTIGVVAGGARLVRRPDDHAARGTSTTPPRTRPSTTACRRSTRRSTTVQRRSGGARMARRRSSPDDPPEGALRRVEAGGRAVCVGRLGRRAGSRSTTPARTRSARSPRASSTEHVVVCPCHGSEFDVRTGDVLTPPALEPLPIYEAREDGGALLVRLSPPAVADGGRARARRPRHRPTRRAPSPSRGRRSTASRSTTSTSPTSTCGSAASRTTGSRSCAATRRCYWQPEQRRAAASGRSRATTTSSRSRRTGRRSRRSSEGRRSRT